MAHKPRILTLLFNQVGKGTYWRTLQLSRSLAQRGYQTTMVVTSAADRWHLRQRTIDGVYIVEVPDLLPGALRSGWDVWATLRRLAWLHSGDFDLVHAVESRPVVLAPALRLHEQGLPLVMEWCDWFGRGGSVEERPNPVVRTALRPVETYLEEHFRTRADGTITINNFLRERALALNVRPDTIEVIPNGCDVRVQPLERLASRRAEGLPPDSPLIGFAGGIYAPDSQFMADALNCLQRQMPDVRLVLAGYFNRPIERYLARPDAVIRTGPTTLARVHQCLAACDVCWLPLQNSGANQGRWPSKLNDYMTLARPVISTAVGDLALVVPKYQIGVVTPVDASAFAEATAELLGDPERRAALGQNARQTAETVFDWELQANKLEDFYAQVLNRA